MNSYETDRCTVSLLQENDFSESLRLLTDEQVRVYLGGPLTEEDAYRRLHFWIEEADSIHYTIRLKDTQALIGIIAVAPHHDAVRKEVSYQFLPEYWGKGYATETMRWVLAHCRANLQLSSVVSETQSANTNSCKLLERLGYTLDSVLVRFGAEQRVYAYDLTTDKFN
ncbi:MAG: GNAT family N-acetyltransferase [Clostridia bacterium]|nr:GNAT family N-acetyltransferase [Clostridia bacterium]